MVWPAAKLMLRFRKNDPLSLQLRVEHSEIPSLAAADCIQVFKRSPQLAGLPRVDKAEGLRLSKLQHAAGAERRKG